MTVWPNLTLADCAAPERYATQIGPFGSALKAEAYRPTGVPLLRGVNVNEGRFHDADFVFIDETTADRLSRYECRPGDVLLVHRGTLGRIGLIPDRARFPRYIMGNSMLRVRTDPTKLLPEFLYYWLTSAAGQQYLFSRTSHVGVPAIPQPLATLREVVLPVPPVPEQRSMVEVLGPLDDKIESNRRLVLVGRDLAKTVLQSAAIAGTPTLVVDVAEVVRGLAYTGAGLAPSGMPMANLGNAENYGWLKRSGLKFYLGPYKERHIAQPGDLLIPSVEQTWSNEILGWPLLLPDDVGPALFSQDLFKVDFRLGELWRRLPLWAALFEPSQRAWLEGHIYGSTVARIPREAIEGLSFRCPSEGGPAIQVADDLIRRAWSAEVESASLATMRDALLSELMSGRLRVHEAQEHVKAVV